MISSDTLDIETVDTTADLERVWRDIVDAGILTLPTSVRRSAQTVDGHSFVVELRVGQEHRVSSIASWHRDEVPADKSIRIIDRILTERIGWP